MLQNKVGQFLSAIFIVSLLSACGSTDDGIPKNSYIQFYNLSPNASETLVNIDDGLLTSVNFAAISTAVEVLESDYELELTRINSSDNEVSLLETLLEPKSNKQHIYILMEDFTQPELIEYQYDLDAVDEDTAELHLLHLSNNLPTTLDVYIGEEDAGFDGAQLIDSLTYTALINEVIIEDGSYVIYLTESGSSTVVFETQEITFNQYTRYIIAIRDDFGAADNNAALDVITSSTKVSYDGVNEGAALTFYSALNDPTSIDIHIDGINANADIAALQQAEFSNKTAVDVGLTTVSVTDVDNTSSVLLRDMVLSLEYDESRTVVFYFDEDESEVSGLSFENETRTRAYQSHINVVNTIDYTEMDDGDAISLPLTIYFLKGTESFDTTDNAVKNLSFKGVSGLQLYNDTYEMYLVYEDGNGDAELFYRSDEFEIEGNMNYTVIAEYSTEEVSGYALRIIENN